MKTNPRRISDGMFECRTLHKTWSICLVFPNKENDEFGINAKKRYKRVNGILKLYPFWIPRITRKTNSWGRKHLSCVDRMFWNYIIRLPCRKVRKSYVILTLVVFSAWNNPIQLRIWCRNWPWIYHLNLYRVIYIHSIPSKYCSLLTRC